MDSSKKGVISKMWGRCTSLSDGVGKNGSDQKKGCFPIHVGPERERFVIKTEQVNHPLFKILLEEAEFEYGYGNTNGPLMLPCHVDHFLGVLIEMDGCDEEEKGSNSSFHFHSPPKVIALAG